MELLEWAVQVGLPAAAGVEVGEAAAELGKQNHIIISIISSKLSKLQSSLFPSINRFDSPRKFTAYFSSKYT